MNRDYSNFELWPYTYAFRFRLAAAGSAGDAVLGAAMSLQGDCDFVARTFTADMQIGGTTIDEFAGMAPQQDFSYGPNGSYGQYTRKIYLPDSRAIQSGIQDPNARAFQGIFGGASNLNGVILKNMSEDGDACRPLPFIPELLLARTSALTLDLRNLSGLGGLDPSAIVLELAFHGHKLFPKGTHFRLEAGHKYRALPFTYYGEIPALGTQATGQLVPNIVTNIDTGSHFQLLSVDCPGWHRGFQMQVYGPNNEQTSFSNSSVRQGLVGRGNLLGTSRFPGVVCPPIMYPAAGRINWDYYLPANTAQPVSNGVPLLVAFRGVKLYE